MHVLPLVDVKASLVLLVGDGVSLLGANHHLVAHHVVVHHVLQSGLESLWVDQVEIDELVSCDLNPHVTFDEVDEASNVDLVVELPLHYFCKLIPHLLEEQNLARASDAQSLVEK